MHSVVWPTQMVKKPRSVGTPINCCSEMNSSSMDRPVMTSGITIGAVIMPANSVLPGKRLKRASTKPAIVPRMTAAVALASAIWIESFTADMICSLLNSETYHLVEKPPHTVTSLEALNEYTIRLTMGMYRNRNPTTSTPLRNGDSLLCIAFTLQLARLVTVQQRDRHDQHQYHDDGHRRRHRPVVVIEELVPQHLADHQRIGPAHQFRNHELAYRRNEHHHRTGDDAVL